MLLVSNRCGLRLVLLLALPAVLFGCSHGKSRLSEQYVFVTAKQGNLRDRVAAVSNRVGEVNNGDRLKVLEHGRHFLKVQNDKGQVGWIEERAVATPETAEAFDQLKAAHKDDADVASGVTRDQVYMHVRPGRDTERFYLLAEGEKLKLLKRATLEKVTTQAVVARAQRAIPEAAGTHAARKEATGTKAAKPAEAAPPDVSSLEDWWLVRDSQGHTGWLFGRMMDVDAPDSLTRYSEGQKIVGAYVLTRVHDEGAALPDKDVPEYVTVTNSYKAGLPYDFDQVRVFTWSLQHHRYETAFRDRNIEGFLPVRLSRMKDASGKSQLAGEELPAFSYKVLAVDAPAVTPDAISGAMTPTKTIEKTYRLEGNLVRRMDLSSAGLDHAGQDNEAHPRAVSEKKVHGRR